MFQPMLRFYRLSPLWGLALPLIGVFYAVFTFDSACSIGAAGRHVEGPRAGDGAKRMSSVAELSVRQGTQGREFSRRLVPDRAAGIAPPVLAFYRFVRAADDVADNADRGAGGESSRCWNEMRASLIGRERCGAAKASRCAQVLEERGLSPEHALDLLEAFRRDVHQAALSRLGRADRLLPLLAPCRWAASCWMCMAKSRGALAGQ